MILRLQSFFAGLMAMLVTALLALGAASANPALGGYQLFEPVALELQQHTQLSSLGNFDYFAKIAPECCNALKIGTQQLGNTSGHQQLVGRFHMPLHQLFLAFALWNLSCGGGLKIRRADLGEQRLDFFAGGGGHRLQRLGSGEQALGRGAVGVNHLMTVEQHVEIFDLRCVFIHIDAGHGAQLDGRDQNLGGVEHPFRVAGLDQHPVLARDDKVLLRQVQTHRARRDTDWAQLRVGAHLMP